MLLVANILIWVVSLFIVVLLQ